jgi:hypothetical protein
MTPFIEPTRWSLDPKSVVSVMMGSGKKSLQFRMRALNLGMNAAIAAPFEN